LGGKNSAVNPGRGHSTYFRFYKTKGEMVVRGSKVRENDRKTQMAYQFEKDGIRTKKSSEAKERSAKGNKGARSGCYFQDQKQPILKKNPKKSGENQQEFSVHLQGEKVRKMPASKTSPWGGKKRL